jgi:hypothetical protein
MNFFAGLLNGLLAILKAKNEEASVILIYYCISVSYKLVTQFYFFNTDNISFNFSNASTGLMVLMSIFSSIS